EISPSARRRPLRLWQHGLRAARRQAEQCAIRSDPEEARRAEHEDRCALAAALEARAASHRQNRRRHDRRGDAAAFCTCSLNHRRSGDFGHIYSSTAERQRARRRERRNADLHREDSQGRRRRAAKAQQHRRRAQASGRADDHDPDAWSVAGRVTFTSPL
ncbi:MAG: hypothetical protein AVDCRST_MAG42-2617, partial [uncultured Chthoniobacterales bacterium]